MSFANLSRTRRTVVVVLSLFMAAGLSACASSGHHDASSKAAGAKSSATATAGAANQQLTDAGYTPLNVPGFGKMDVGISSTSSSTSAPKPHYMLVYTYTGSNPALVGSIVASAERKLSGNDGVTLKAVTVSGTSFIIATADKLHDLKTATEAILESAK